MAKIESIDGPIGWLIDPHKRWAIHFYLKKPPSDHLSTDFTIDMWGVLPSDKPMEFKSRRKVTKADSIKTWKQLIASKWVKFDFEKKMTA